MEKKYYYMRKSRDIISTNISQTNYDSLPEKLYNIDFVIEAVPDECKICYGFIQAVTSQYIKTVLYGAYGSNEFLVLDGLKDFINRYYTLKFEYEE